MKRAGKKIMVVGAGIGIVIAGVLGWFLPVVPGTLLLILGLLVISSKWQWLDDELDQKSDRWLEKYPNMQSRVRSVRRKISGIFG